jgi:hypothetical protein
MGWDSLLEPPGPWAWLKPAAWTRPATLPLAQVFRCHPSGTRVGSRQEIGTCSGLRLLHPVGTGWVTMASRTGQREVGQGLERNPGCWAQSMGSPGHLTVEGQRLSLKVAVRLTAQPSGSRQLRRPEGLLQSPPTGPIHRQMG